MYQVNQIIVYGSAGVCRVEAVEVPANLPNADGRLYYRLRPLFEASIIYTPVDTTVFMRPVLTREEAQALLAAYPQLEPAPCESRSPQVLGEHYKSFFRSHSCEDLLRLIKTIRQKAQASGRPLSKTDQNYLRRAEELLYCELSAALQLPRAEVKLYAEQLMQPQ